jgi:hypothetical protein
MSENTEELKSQLEEGAEEEEKEEEGKEEEGKEEGREEKGKEEEGKEEKGKEKEKEEGGEEFQMPDKFKGKSPEEIAKSYAELEGMIDKKAEEKARELAKKKEEGEFEEEEKEEKEFEETPPMKGGKIDFASMTPEGFAKWLLKEVDKRAEEKAKKIYSDSSKVRGAVREEIREAQKGHPLLKTSGEYRELVLAIIESAASKGKTIKLDEACTKVDALIGGGKKEPGEEEKEKLKKARAQVETGAGAAPGAGEETDEEKIKEGMLKGQKTGELGGLGI